MVRLAIASRANEKSKLIFYASPLRFPAMDSSNYRVRRATLDDLAQLTGLWQAMRLAAADLGKRITEFQVAEGPDGKVLGAIALQVVARQGRIHSEGFVDFSQADKLRP